MTIPNLPAPGNTFTPDGKVIKDADTRKWVGIGLWTLSLLAAIVSMFVQFFPEVAGDGDYIQRSVAFANALVSLLSGAFGLAVTTPNVRN